MIDEDTVKKVTKIFGIPNPFLFYYLWIAEIPDYFTQDIIVAVVKRRNTQLSGLLLALPLYNSLSGNAKEDDLAKYIDLPSWNDPVKTALQSINLLREPWDEKHEVGEIIEDPDKAYLFNFQVSTLGFWVSFHASSGFSGNRSMMNLREAILSTTKFLAEVYNDKKITEWITPKPIVEDFDDYDPNGEFEEN